MSRSFEDASRVLHLKLRFVYFAFATSATACVLQLQHQPLLTSARARQKRDLQICSAQMLMQVSALSTFGWKVGIRIAGNE